MRIGDWTQAPLTARVTRDLGLPLRPRTSAAQLATLRTFFRDAQE